MPAQTVVVSPTAANEPDKPPMIAQPWEHYDTILRHAERARVNGDAPRAHTFYSRLVELNPNDARGWAGLAETAASLDETIMSWAYVLALEPNNWEARAQMDARIEERIKQSGIADAAVLVALSRTLVEVAQKPAANRVLTRATELDPTNIEAWLWRAGVTEDRVDAIDCLNQVLSMDPGNAQAKAGLKWALSKEKDARGRVSADDAQRAVNSFEEGQSALRANDIPRAHDCFERATELDPNYESAWFWRGSTTEDIDEAVTCMDRTLAIHPQNQAAKDTKWWLSVKKYSKVLNHRVALSQQVDEQANAQSATAQPAKQSGVRYFWFVLFFVVIVLIMLGVGVVWRLAQ